MILKVKKDDYVSVIYKDDIAGASKRIDGKVEKCTYVVVGIRTVTNQLYSIPVKSVIDCKTVQM